MEFLLQPYFVEIPVFNVNSIDPDQTPLSAASDLGLHSLQMPLLRYARHIWVMGNRCTIYRLRGTDALRGSQLCQNCFTLLQRVYSRLALVNRIKQ